MAVIRLTDALLKKQKPKARQFDLRDSRQPEMVARVYPSGRVGWMVSKWHRGASRRWTFGTFRRGTAGPVIMNVGQARQQLLLELAKLGDQGAAAQATEIRNSLPDLAGWFQQFIQKNPRRLEPETMRYHGHRFSHYIKHRLGQLQLDEITSAHLEDLTLQVEKQVGARTANLCRLLVTSLLAWARDRGMMPAGWTMPKARAAAENPVRENNFIPRGKAPDFFQAVQALRCRPGYRFQENGTAADVILVALFTGARKSNVITMAWDEIDLQLMVWHIPVAKYKTRKTTGAGVTIPLIPVALEILKARKQSAKGPWVFPSSRDSTKPINSVNKSWHWVRQQAGLPHVTFHGLRHTLGTWQGQLGVSLNFIAKSLGQKALQSAARYTHPDLETVRGNMAQAVQANSLTAGQAESDETDGQ